MSRALGHLAVLALRDLRVRAYPVAPGFRQDGQGPYPLDLRSVSHSFQPGPDGVVAVAGPDGRPYRNPVSASLYALARHTETSGQAGQQAGGLAGFIAQASYLRDSQDANGGWRYPIPVARYRVAPGWYSAMAQGLAISVLLRAYDATGQSSYLDAAGAAATLMLMPLGAGGCADYDETGRPFLEECPSDPPCRILNGAVFAVIGLREHEARTGGHGHSAAAGLRLAAQLDRYDLGYWSRYDQRFAVPASLAYHYLHISLLEVAARLFADDAFSRAAAVWRSYPRNPGNRLRAAVNKARFVLGDGRG